MPPKAPLLKQRIKKPKLLRSNPLRLSLIRSGISPSELDLINDEDILVSARRRDNLVSNKHVYGRDEDLPKDIEWKLFLARQVAMMRYREIHGQERT